MANWTGQFSPHQKLSTCLEPTGSICGCFNDRLKAVDEISYSIQVDKNQKCISLCVEDHIRFTLQNEAIKLKFHGIYRIGIIKEVRSVYWYTTHTEMTFCTMANLTTHVYIRNCQSVWNQLEVIPVVSTTGWKLLMQYLIPFRLTRTRNTLFSV